MINLVDERFIEAKIEAFENLLRPWWPLWGFEPLQEVTSPGSTPKLGTQEESLIQDLMAQMWSLSLGELASFLAQIESWRELQTLATLPARQSDSPAIQLNKQRKLGEKKRHEIEQLLQVVTSQQPPPEHIWDCAAGQGHFAHHFLQHTQAPQLYSLIDRNPELIALAKDKLQQYGVRFLQADLLSLQVDNDQGNRHLWLGLHACGSLTDWILSQATTDNAHHVCVVGCCYHLLPPQWEQQQKSKLILSSEALTLAAKDHGPLQEKDLLHRLRVKRYRYALEIAWREEPDLLELSAQQRSQSLVLKSFPGSTYQQSYDHYLKLALARQKISYTQKKGEQLEAHRLRPEVQWRLHQLFLRGLLRSYFARPLEVYLSYLRLRALCQKLNRPVPELTTIFDHGLSPRNILLTSRK